MRRMTRCSFLFGASVELMSGSLAMVMLTSLLGGSECSWASLCSRLYKDSIWAVVCPSGGILYRSVALRFCVDAGCAREMTVSSMFHLVFFLPHYCHEGPVG